MPDDASVTFWIDKLKSGDPDAAQPLWNRYFHHLVRLAYQRLRGAPRAAADEEDVALSAFKSFCLAAEKGRFPLLADRDDLWRLLIVITERKAGNLVRDQARLKRGGDVGENLPLDAATIPSHEPTPLLAAQVAEEYERLLSRLESDTLQKIALDKMEGFCNEEIAVRHTLALRTVERKLGLIRRIWEQDLGAT